MHSALLEEFEEIQKIPVERQNEERLREKLHLLMGRLHLQGAGRPVAEEMRLLADMMQGCYKKLRTLENMTLSQAASIQAAPCELTPFFEELYYAADLILGACGKHMQFECPGRSVRLVCDQAQLRSALLNLMTQVLGGPGEHTVRLGMKAGYGGVRFFVSGKSGDGLSALCRSAARPGSGLYAASHIAQLHAGRLVCSARGGYVQFAFSVSTGIEAAAPPKPSPDFAEYICDRFSPLYIGLSTVCPCPV